MPGGPAIFPFGRDPETGHPLPPPGGPTFQELEEQRQNEERAEFARGVSPQAATEVTGIYQSAEGLLDQSWRGKMRSILQEAGAPMDDFLVQEMLKSADAQSERFDSEPGLFDAVVQTTIDGLIQSGKISQTPYTQALQMSGFGFERPEFVAIAPGQFGSEFAAISGGFETQDYVVNPQTGWKQYKNGTLVDPNQPFGSVAAVTYDPTSRAPGSPLWLQEVVPSWSPEKINEWREKLIDGGYLSTEEKKGPVDTTFLNAMQQYQAVRYQNGGTPMALGPVIGAGAGTTPYNFQQIRASIDEDVRNAWFAIYGTRPDEDEVEAQRDMVISVAHKLYKKGQLSPEGAASEAEARILGRMERTPEARFVTENVEENTELRDRMLRAVQVTSMMS